MILVSCSNLVLDWLVGFIWWWWWNEYSNVAWEIVLMTVLGDLWCWWWKELCGQLAIFDDDEEVSFGGCHLGKILIPNPVLGIKDIHNVREHEWIKHNPFLLLGLRYIIRESSLPSYPKKKKGHKEVPTGNIIRCTDCWFLSCPY